MNSRPRIAVVGASTRAAAFSLVRAGIDVASADLFADADLRAVCSVTKINDYPTEIADWLATCDCDGWLYTGALENHAELIEQMARLRPLLGNNGDVLRRVRGPLVLQEALSAVGLNFPETKRCDGSPPGDGEWLHKTGQGASGSGVKRASGLVPEGCGPKGFPSGGHWQRCIPGVSGSAIYIDGELRGITRQLIGEDLSRPNKPSPSPSLKGRGISDFQYCGTLAPWNLPLTTSADITQLGQVLSIQYGVRGLFGVDFIFDGERIWPVEVNPRVTAAVEVVERVTGTNLLAEHLGAFGIATANTHRSPAPAAGKVILYTKQPLTISQVSSKKLLVDAGPHNSPQLADIPNPGTKISVGEPILTLLAEDSSIEQVETNLRERVASLEQELYGGSGDTVT